MTDQITVTESAVPAALGSAARQILLALGGWAIGRGYLNGDTLTAIITVGAVIGPIIYGQFKGWSNHQDAVAMAKALPDSVATVK